MTGRHYLHPLVRLVIGNIATDTAANGKPNAAGGMMPTILVVHPFVSAPNAGERLLRLSRTPRYAAVRTTKKETIMSKTTKQPTARRWHHRLVRLLTAWAWKPERADTKRLDAMDRVGENAAMLVQHQWGNRTVRVAIDVALSDEANSPEQPPVANNMLWPPEGSQNQNKM